MIVDIVLNSVSCIGKFRLKFNPRAIFLRIVVLTSVAVHWEVSTEV